MLEDRDTSTYSDEALLALSIEEPGYFSALVDRYQKAFLRKSFSILKNEGQAEDATQDVLVKIYKKADTFKSAGAGSFKAWAYRVLVNHCFSIYRKNERERERTLHLETEHYENLGDGSDARDNDFYMTDYVTSVFARMPDPLARMLKLYFIDGYSQKEIAEHEKLSLVAVRVRMYRAKQAFRKATDDQK